MPMKSDIKTLANYCCETIIKCFLDISAECFEEWKSAEFPDYKSLNRSHSAMCHDICQKYNQSLYYFMFGGHVNYFEYLPSTLLTKVFQFLKNERNVLPEVINLLVCPQLELLNLSDSLLNFSGVHFRIKDLKYLMLSGNCSLSSYDLAIILKSSPLLEHLDISNSKHSDLIVSLISRYCPKIRYLDLSNCYNISASGILTLCFGVDDVEISVSRVKCPDLRYLGVHGHQLPTQEVSCLLKHFPGLELLNTENSIGAIHLIAEELSLSESDQISFKLKHLYSHLLKGDAPLITANRLCPQVTALTLDSPEVLSEPVLEAIRSFRNLIQLQIEFDQSLDSYKFQFLLRGLGSRLKVLCLHRIAYIHLYSVLLHCSELSQLEITIDNSCVVQDDIEGYKSLKPLNYLNKLKLTMENVFSVDTPFTKEFYFYLLCSTGLEDLHLINLKNLSEDALLKIFKVNNFPCLKFLTVDMCPGVTGAVMEVVLKLNNPLSKILIKDCDGLTEQNILDTITFVKKNKLILKVTFLGNSVYEYQNH